MKLLAESAEGAGYLLKDRISDVREFVGAVERVANGGSAKDIVTRLDGVVRQYADVLRAAQGLPDGLLDMGHDDWGHDPDPHLCQLVGAGRKWLFSGLRIRQRFLEGWVCLLLMLIRRGGSGGHGRGHGCLLTDHKVSSSLPAR